MFFYVYFTNSTLSKIRNQTHTYHIYFAKKIIIKMLLSIMILLITLISLLISTIIQTLNISHI